jgi:hypothetical protein
MMLRVFSYFGVFRVFPVPLKERRPQGNLSQPSAPSRHSLNVNKFGTAFSKPPYGKREQPLIKQGFKS